MFAKDSPLHSLPKNLQDKYLAILNPKENLEHWKIPNSTAIFYTNLEYTDHFWLDRQRDLNNANIPEEQRTNALPDTPEGFHTIEHTPGGRALIDAILNEDPPLPREIRSALWHEASKRYATEAEGDVIALVYEGNTQPRFSYDDNSEKSKAKRDSDNPLQQKLDYTTSGSAGKR